MKSSFSTFIISLVTLLLASCGGGAPVSLSLENISANDCPKSSDVWIITDATASTSDFKGLSDAIKSLADSGREIELQLPNMKEIPDYAIYGEKRTTNPSMKSADEIAGGESAKAKPFQALKSVDAAAAESLGDFAFYGCNNISSFSAPKLQKIGDASLYECTSLTSISLPEVSIIGELSFAYCSKLESVELPKVTQIGALALHVCHSLRSIELATDGNAVLKSIGDNIEKGAFFNASTPEAILTIGQNNEGLVDENSLAINPYNILFKQIKIQNR